MAWGEGFGEMGLFDSRALGETDMVEGFGEMDKVDWGDGRGLWGMDMGELGFGERAWGDGPGYGRGPGPCGDGLKGSWVWT